jgi:hypothetical protein
MVREIEKIIEDHFEFCSNPHETIYRLTLILKLKQAVGEC